MGRNTQQTYAHEEFQENFLRNWESKKPCFSHNKERLKQFLENAKDAGFVVPGTLTLNSSQTEKVVDAIMDEAGLDSTEQALTLLAILFQEGGTARECDGKLKAEVQGKKLRFQTVRDYMRDFGLPRMERRLARSLATPIYEV